MLYLKMVYNFIPINTNLQLKYNQNRKKCSKSNLSKVNNKSILIKPKMMKEEYFLSYVTYLKTMKICNKGINNFYSAKIFT